MFVDTVVQFGSSHQTGRDGELSQQDVDDFWGPPRSPYDAETVVSGYDDFRKYKDEYDEIIAFWTARDPDRDKNIERRREKGWVAYRIGDHLYDPGNKVVWNAEELRHVLGITRACRRLREESLPMLCGSIHVVIRDANLYISDLPQRFRDNYLPHVHKVSFAGETYHGRRNREFDYRYRYNFDLPQLPSLKIVHLRSQDETHQKKIYLDSDMQYLRECCFDGKQEEHIENWFQQQSILTFLQESHRMSQTPENQRLLQEKNATRYWFRDLMLNPAKRKFKVFKRMQLTIDLIHLKPGVDKDTRPLVAGQLEGRALVYVDLDFDVDTHEVVDRFVCDILDREHYSPGWTHFSDRKWHRSGTEIEWIIDEELPDGDTTDPDEDSDEDVNAW